MTPSGRQRTTGRVSRCCKRRGKTGRKRGKKQNDSKRQAAHGRQGFKVLQEEGMGGYGVGWPRRRGGGRRGGGGGFFQSEINVYM